ncbi:MULTISPECIES: helix-turn-helix domain-containing protein [unclassified Pedobacter]|uniref:helix-turn-helix domain-containing protein n=1 Tax=unclassified Pedobacter TaxID=2628915 RepID=UPI00141E61B1|nr:MULTISPECIES: helix-turn-helix domain-containing protein [unclassified Pedobacter]NII83086.1 AraC-like DNA-binding protein [Pedobacter sp. SG908]NMN37104.1 AraC-like DNA-binding protein [Pedobacter sp. SG918]
MHLFFAKRGNKLLNILLSVIFFARFGQILTSLLFKSGQPYALAFFHQTFTPFYYAAPACFYLYITGFLQDRKNLQKIEWLHFVPALLAIIHVIPWHFSTTLNWNLIGSQLAENGYFSLKAKSGLFPPYFHYLFRPVLVFGYLCLTWVAVLRLKNKPQQILEGEGRKWIIFFLRIATFFQLFSLVPIILRSLHIPYVNASFIVLNCLALLVILLYALHKPYIFYGYLLVAVDWTKKPVTKKLETNQAETDAPLLSSSEKDLKPTIATVKKINLLDAQLSDYAFAMKEIMEREQLYLLHNFQIIDLAAKLNIPIHHCSFVINKHIGKNFRDWINSYRVDHFLKQYPLKSDKITIEAIASEAGFKNLATFYNAFKKETGVMPTTYFA